MFLLKVLMFLFSVGLGDAIRCYECQQVSLPNECQNIKDCGVGEECYTEQVATIAGGFIYNTGCRKSSRCPTQGIALIGKRSNSVGKDARAIDITTCIECCNNDTCNVDGCRVKEIPITVRGPYCFNCDNVDDPKHCTNMTACSKDQVCMLSQYTDHQQTRYKSHCETQTTCDLQLKAAAGSNTSCLPLCCKNDFCNNHCELATTTTTTTTTTTHTTPTSQPTSHATHHVTTSNSHYCHTNKGYIHLHSHNAELCVRIVLHHTTFDHARDTCRHEGGDLVALDTYAKSLLLRNKLSETDHSGYWVGARDFNHNNHFLWVNHHSAQTSDGNWGGGQPDNYHHGRNQNCVYLPVYDDYRWHDSECENHFNFICEQQKN